MAQSLNVKIAGLYTYPSDLSAVPPGALVVADNIVLDQDSVATPRRGLDYLAHGSGVQSAFSMASYVAAKYFFYQNQTISHYGLYGAPTYLAYHDPVNGWTNLGTTFAPPSATVPMRSAQANENFYFTTNAGVMKLAAYNAAPVAIGAPPGLDIQAVPALSSNPLCTTVSGSTTVTVTGGTTGIGVNMTVSGTGIQTGTYVTDVLPTYVVLSLPATSSGTNNITFQPGTSNSSPFLLSGYSAAYRVLFGYTDVNGNLVIGAPSAYVSVFNYIGQTTGVNVTFTLPQGLNNSYFYQLYRSASVAAGITPADDMQLVQQGNISNADLTTTQLTVTDITPDALRGTALYTNASQEGLANENYPPPLAQDLAVYRGCLFLANTQGLQNFALSLFGVGSPNGLQLGDTIGIGTATFTAANTENIAAKQFQLFTPYLQVIAGNTTSGVAQITGMVGVTGITGGTSVTGTGIPAGTYVTGIASSTSVYISQQATATATGTNFTFTGDSAAQAIRDTCLSLVRVVNRSNVGIYGYYTSSATGIPGQMNFTAVTLIQGGFNVVSSRTPCWNPPLPQIVAGGFSSSNDVNKNYLYYSNQNQPEAVPLANFIPVGSADKNILRIIALRDSLLILKEDGTFFLSGTDPTNFTLNPLDYTSILIAPESAVALNNQVFCLTTQGVVAINTIGSPIQSHPIEGNLTSLVAQNYALLQQVSFGVAYESSRSYYLFCPTQASDTYPTQYYRFNYITNTWTRGILSKTCGAVSPVSDRLYLGNALAPITDVERKSLTYSDYADYQSTQTISLVTGNTLVITEADTLAVGSIIYQGPTVFGTIASVNPVTGVVTTTLPTSLVPGNADVLGPIPCTMEWAPFTFDNPGYSKQVREVTVLFLADFNGTGNVSFTSDLNPAAGVEVIQGGQVGGWGLFAWGGASDSVPSTGALNVLGVPWGGDPRRRPVRVSVTRNQQRCSILNVSWSHAYAYSPWKVQGISLIGGVISERTTN